MTKGVNYSKQLLEALQRLGRFSLTYHPLGLHYFEAVKVAHFGPLQRQTQFRAETYTENASLLRNPLLPTPVFYYPMAKINCYIGNIICHQDTHFGLVLLWDSSVTCKFMRRERACCTTVQLYSSSFEAQTV